VPPYDRRDLIGHWITRRQREQQPCTHACCRGYRVHPGNYPVVLPSRTLRRASDDDLYAHYRRVYDQGTPESAYAEDQIMHEMERRDQAAQLARDRKAGRAAARAAARMDREAEEERIFLEAEAYTRGKWTNLKGSARGISDREILRGREAIFQRYASEEAREFFRYNPRPTAAYFRGKDTSIAYSDPQARR
jgi:hypothetical protein